MEREVRRSKYSMMVFSEPNRSKLVLPPLPHWWVLMCTPHRKWKLTKKLIFSTKVDLSVPGWRNIVCLPPGLTWDGRRRDNQEHTPGRRCFCHSQEWVTRRLCQCCHVHISEWSLWSPSSLPAELLVGKGLCKSQWPSSWVTEAGWVCENKISAFVTPVLHAHNKTPGTFNSL